MAPQVRQTLTSDWEKLDIEIPKTIFRQPEQDRDSYIGFHPRQLQFDRPMQHFVTGSSYEGCWNSLGFSGVGTYFFTHGAVYQGNFRDGEFHGKGTITYPTGHRMKGYWKNGKLVNHIFVFSDGLAVTHPWKYCQMPDRRFQIEFNTSLKGPGEEFLTNRQPTIEVPEGCYDTIDGFYVPDVKCVYKYDEEALIKDKKSEHKRQTDNLKRTVQAEEGEFIENNYRASHLETVGYRPDLYEFWTGGRANEIDEILNDLNCETFGAGDPSGTCITTESSVSEIGVNIEFQVL